MSGNQKNVNYPLFVRADADAFFGLLADTIAKVLVIVGTMLYVFQAPPWLVFGRILPGIGIATAFGAFYYAYQVLCLPSLFPLLSISVSQP